MNKLLVISLFSQIVEGYSTTSLTLNLCGCMPDAKTDTFYDTIISCFRDTNIPMGILLGFVQILVVWCLEPILIIIIIMVIFKCYFSGEHITLSLKNNNGVNIELGKTNRLKALCMMQINT